MVGKATFTIVASRMIMSCAPAMTARASPRFLPSVLLPVISGASMVDIGSSLELVVDGIGRSGGEGENYVVDNAPREVSVR